MSEHNPLDLKTIRERLSSVNGERYWRSLDELADTPEFNEFLHREFPREASVWDDAFSRRGFMKLMGASLALGGLSGCVKQPAEKIIPYVKQPEELVPGKPLYFATAAPGAGGSIGVLVKSHMGRPVHIEGNPDHAASLGSTDVFAQASILSLYDPDRSQVVLRNGAISTWSKFYEALQLNLDIQRTQKGAGLRILSEPILSPTLAKQMQSVLEQFPEARWHQYEPLNNDAIREGALMAFGEYAEPQYKFEKADVVLSLDADFMTHGAGHVRYSRDYSERRKVQGPAANMNRLYVAESTPTVTGSVADHRLRLRASEVESFTRAVASLVGVAGVNASSLEEKRRRWASAVANDLMQHKGTSIVIAGSHQPPAVHALVHSINEKLGNHGQTIVFTEPVGAMKEPESLASLAGDINAGKVDLLLVLGGNPVYSTPAEMGFDALIKKIGFSAHLGLYVDETSAACMWHIPECHFLEAWSDTRAFDGTATIMQPLIAPLYNSVSSHELVEFVLGRPDRKGYDVVKEFWRGQYTAADFEQFWNTSLNNGFVEGSASPLKQVTMKSDPSSWQAAAPSSGMEIMFQPDPSVWDGRYANNGWLQELPKPLTKITWDNAAYISPATAERLGIANKDVVELKYQGGNVEAPVWIWMGHPDEAVTLHLGYGRTKAGRVGSGIGVNANALRKPERGWFDGGLELRKTEARYDLASTQDHHSMEGRPIVRSANVEEFEKDPTFAKEMAHSPKPEESLYPPFEYDGNAWAMTIDLNACTGCNVCTIACQSENNIPVVGKDQVLNGREMHWIRIDRYYGDDIDDPEVYTQPLGCVHCENAPCEVVCPVAATTHDSEGLNVMTYNRCVGTRYCANNCPYKVRRFNFLQYSDTETETYQMMRNPDVTVRNRGVMEKCTYCVQRISTARIEAKKEGREIRDGEVVTACQSACPAQAITFGNVNDKQSKVAQLKADPRAYGLLDELNTKPRTSFLAKLTNPNPELKKLEQAG